MDQFQWMMDSMLARVDGVYVRLIMDPLGKAGAHCGGNTLVVSTGGLPELVRFLRRVRGDGKRANRRVARLGLYHMADEAMSVDPSLFDAFDYSFHEYGRAGRPPREALPVPLGPVQAFGAINPLLALAPPELRSHGCFFKGKARKPPRSYLVREGGPVARLCTVSNTKGFKKGSHPHALRVAAGDTSICLAPPGANIESFRVWESLEAGCVPVLTDAEPHTSILGHDAPVLRLSNESWMDASSTPLISLLQPYLSSPELMSDKLREVGRWYRGFKQRTQHEVATRVLGRPPATATADDVYEDEDHGRGGGGTCVVFFSDEALPSFRFLLDSVLRDLRTPFLKAFFAHDDLDTTTTTTRLPAACLHRLLVVQGDERVPELQASGLLDRPAPAAAAGGGGRLGLVALGLSAEPLSRLVSLQQPLDLLLLDAASWTSWSAASKHAASGGDAGPTLQAELLVSESRRALRRSGGDERELAVAEVVFLPHGPRTAFGAQVPLQQSTRPAATRQHACLSFWDLHNRPDQHHDGTDGGRFHSLCPKAFVHALQDDGVRRPSFERPSHANYLRARLLDTAVAALPPRPTDSPDLPLLWEALECGAIPVIDAGLVAALALQRQEEEDGGEEPCPLPAFTAAEWSSGRASASIEQLAGDADMLAGLQRRVLEWYVRYKRRLRSRVADALA